MRRLIAARLASVRLTARRRLLTSWLCTARGRVGTLSIAAGLATVWLTTPQRDRTLRARARLGSATDRRVALRIAAQHSTRVGLILSLILIRLLPHYLCKGDPAASQKQGRNHTLRLDCKFMH